MTKKNKDFHFTLIVEEADLTLPWSHVRAKLWKTFNHSIDGLKTVIDDINIRDGKRTVEKVCHS